MSGFVQSVGYLLGAAGPIAVGVLRDATGGWTVSILVLLAITIPMTITGLICCRVWFIEDEIAGTVPS